MWLASGVPETPRSDAHGARTHAIGAARALPEGAGGAMSSCMDRSRQPVAAASHGCRSGAASDHAPPDAWTSPTRQSALAGVEQALFQVALLPARESERVVAPLELTLAGRPTEQQGPRPRRRLPSPESSRLVSRPWVLVACSSEAGVISCRARRGRSTRSTSEHGSRGKCPVLSTFRFGPNASRRAKSLGPGKPAVARASTVWLVLTGADTP